MTHTSLSNVLKQPCPTLWKSSNDTVDFNYFNAETIEMGEMSCSILSQHLGRYLI